MSGLRSSFRADETEEGEKTEAWSSGKASGISRWLRKRIGPREVVLVFALIYCVTFFALTAMRHAEFSSARFDLGNMDQAVWNSANGRILESTSETGENRSRLANHADFLLLAFVPLYWIHESPYWLLFVQAAVVGLGALPLFWLARRFVGSAWPAALIAVAYLFNPGLQSANTFDFHAQTLAPTFLLFAFHFLLERRLWPFVVFGALAAFCKEEISLLVAMMGVYVLIAERRPRWGIPVFAAGVGYFLLVMLVVIPAFNDGGTSELVSGRYAEVGGSMGGIVSTALTDPGRIFSHVFTADKLFYLLDIVGHGGLIGVFAPMLFLPALPEVAINLLSDRPQMTDFHYHYSATIIPFAYLATAAVISKVASFVDRTRRLAAISSSVPLILASWVLLFNVYADLTRGPIPIALNYDDNPVVMASMPEEFEENVAGAVAAVPTDPEASVSVSNWIAPHLAHRETLYLFPVIKDADYVVVDLARPSYYTGISRELGQRVLDRELLDNPDYRIVYSERNVVVFERVE